MGNIRIKLMSDLCSGNGESVGYGIDNDICPDNYGFPYIPGKRILGCLREAAVQLKDFGLQEVDDETIDEIFGNANGKEGKLSITNAVIPGIDSLHSYVYKLKNSEKRDYLIRQCTEEKVIRLYSSVRGQTKISNDGRAEGGSLRFVRVLNQYDPIDGNELEFICETDTSGLNDKQLDIVEKACKTLHHIGMNRTRGLGNVLVVPELKVENSENNLKQVNDLTTSGCEEIIVKYQIEFDSPITTQEYLENSGQIEARTIIGIFSGIYIREHGAADKTFDDLFLNGTVKWSAITPVINELHSDPAPAMIMKLKNDGGKFENVFVPNDSEWKRKKPKSLNNCFASYDENSNELYISQPETEAGYHNRINETANADRTRKGLYMQDALRQGMVYGGYIILPKDNAEDIKKLLSNEKIRLGRSRKTQYGSATIKKVELDQIWSAP